MKTRAEFEQLTESVGQILEAASDTNSAVAALLPAMAKSFDGQWASYWKVNPEAQVVRAIATWSEEAGPFQALLRDTEARAFTAGEGAVGRVWRSGKPISSNDLVGIMCLPRSLHATKSGCTSGMWISIRTDQTTCGVLELLGKHSWPDNHQFLEQLRALGASIGRRLPENRTAR
jgi:hypothetical protein